MTYETHGGEDVAAYAIGKVLCLPLPELDSKLSLNIVMKNNYTKLLPSNPKINIMRTKLLNDHGIEKCNT